MLDTKYPVNYYRTFAPSVSCFRGGQNGGIGDHPARDRGQAGRVRSGGLRGEARHGQDCRAAGGPVWPAGGGGSGDHADQENRRAVMRDSVTVNGVVLTKDQIM